MSLRDTQRRWSRHQKMASYKRGMWVAYACAALTLFLMIAHQVLALDVVEATGATILVLPLIGLFFIATDAGLWAIAGFPRFVGSVRSDGRITRPRATESTRLQPPTQPPRQRPRR